VGYRPINVFVLYQFCLLECDERISREYDAFRHQWRQPKWTSNLPGAPKTFANLFGRSIRREEIGVQAADLWVRELMKFLDGTLFSPDYKPREQWDILLRTKRFGGDLQFGSYFQSMKDQMATLEQNTGLNKERYIAWLLKKKRQDNQSNRIEYMRDVAASDRSRSGKPKRGPRLVGPTEGVFAVHFWNSVIRCQMQTALAA
jgi:hypothetical protein